MVIKYNPKKDLYERVFRKNTVMVGYELTIVLCVIHIEKNRLQFTDFENSGESIDYSSSDAFGDDLGNFEIIYEWKNNKYELVQKNEIENNCSPIVKALNIRKEPDLKSKRIGSIKETDAAQVKMIPWMARGMEYENIDNVKGLWVCIKYGEAIGYCYSYYLEFEYSFISNFMKTDNDNTAWQNARLFKYVTISK